MTRSLVRMLSPRHLKEQPLEAGLFAGASGVPQSSEKFRMGGSRITREGLADERPNIVVCHLLALVLGHGRTPFKHSFEASPNGVYAEPVCGFVEDLLGQPRMERCPCAAEDRLPLGLCRDDVRAERAPRHPAWSRNDHQPPWCDEACRRL